MKYRILILIGAAFVLAVSCDKETVVEDDVPVAIGFGSYQSRATGSVPGTRANVSKLVDGANLPDSTSFGVFAFFHSGTEVTPGTWNKSGQQNHPNFMLNQKVDVAKDAYGNYTYSYSPSKFWPAKGNRISFYAYYPYAAGGYYQATGTTPGSSSRYQLSTYMDKTTNGEGSFGFDVAYEAKDHIDLMVSDLCADQNKKDGVLTNTASGEGDGTVLFNFHHVLSQVRIATLVVSKNNDDVTITPTAIRFSNVAVHGECNVDEDWSTLASNGLVRNSFHWSNQLTTRVGDSNVRGIHVDYTGEKQTGETDEEYALRVKKNYLMMIPQTFTDDATITVIYDVVRKANSAGEYYTYKDNEVSAKLNTAKVGGVPLTSWEPNTIYNYTASVSLEGIELTATYVDWTEGSEDLDLKH